LITHFLGREEVQAYSRDFALRLVALQNNFPTKWFLLGQSGEKIAQVVFDFLPPEIASTVELTTVYVDRKTQEVKFENSIADVKFDSSPVLLIDSAVHSGQSMSQVIWKLWGLGAQNVLTYTLMLKRSSKVIPTYFGILVDDTDRVYFQLDVMPNNRLCEQPPFGILKEVSDEDLSKTIGDVGLPFEGITIGTMLYDKKTKNYYPYIYEYAGNIAGFVSFVKKQHSLFIDMWATVKTFRGQGIGGALLRWAETWARSNKCESIELWAFKDSIKIYQHYEYEIVPGQEMALSDTETFKLMRKKILYHMDLEFTA
jgi:GNAT superfamily N-acetyltransferase